MKQTIEDARTKLWAAALALEALQRQGEASPALAELQSHIVRFLIPQEICN